MQDFCCISLNLISGSARALCTNIPFSASANTGWKIERPEMSEDAEWHASH